MGGRVCVCPVLSQRSSGSLSRLEGVGTDAPSSTAQDVGRDTSVLGPRSPAHASTTTGPGWGSSGIGAPEPPCRCHWNWRALMSCCSALSPQSLPDAAARTAPPTSPTPAPLLPRTEQAAARAPSARAPFLPTRCQLSFLPNDICSWGQGGQGLGWAGGGPEKAVALARRAARPGNQMGKGLEAQAQSLNVQVRESGKRELPSGAGVKG